MIDKLRAKYGRKDDGFTLIELLIVIIILGILATIVLFATGTFSQDAKNSAKCANAKILNTADAAYAAQNDGNSANGDITKLQPYITDDIPTSGTGAPSYNSGDKKWEC